MKNTAGFTLIELIITVVLISVVALIAIPNFTLMVRSNQVTTQTNNMLVAFQTARTEAIRRGVVVSVCPTANQTSCSGTWADGWLIAIDANQTGSVSISNNDSILQIGAAASNSIQIVPGTGAAYARFLGDGTRDRSGTTASLSWTVQSDNCQGDRARIVSLNLSGRVQSQAGPCNA